MLKYAKVVLGPQDIAVTSPNGGRQLDAMSCQKETSTDALQGRGSTIFYSYIIMRSYYVSCGCVTSLVLESFRQSRAALLFHLLPVFWFGFKMC